MAQKPKNSLFIVKNAVVTFLATFYNLGEILA